MKKCVDTIYLFRYNNFYTAEEHKVRTERMLSKGNVAAVPETGILPDGKQKRKFFRKQPLFLFCEKYLERYRSGHNEAVLKTVCPQGRVGSNPTLSAGNGRAVFR